MRENTCKNADSTVTEKKRHRRAAVVWVLDETGYHAIPEEEYEARQMAEIGPEQLEAQQEIKGAPSDTSSDSAMQAPKKEALEKVVPPSRLSDNVSESNSQESVEVMEPLPETYTVEDIMTILRLGRNAAYNLVHSKAFPVIRIGNLLRIPKSSFHEWLNSSPVVFM